MPKDYDAFISYTRQQGATLAERVFDLLKVNGFKVWQDHTHMRGGEDFWRQIENAIEHSYYLIMVLTPDAFEGDRLILRNEWLTARRRGCAVLPVFGSGGNRVDFSSPTVPAWLKKLDCYNIDDANHKAKLANDLRTPPPFRPVPHNVEFPTHFVRREEEMAMVLQILTGTSGNAKVATTTLLGSGGFGKTTLAKALCFEDSVLAHFTDGVLWLTVGEGERNPASLLTTLLQELGQTPKSADEDALLGQWREELRTRQCLVVLDDVWRESDALALVVRETTSAFLITSRIPRVAVAVDAKECLVDEMRADQGQTLLGRSLGETVNRFELRLRLLAEKAGYWPVLLGLISAQLALNLRRPGASPEQALAFVEEDLSDLGLTAFDRQNSQKRADAVARTIAASLKYLAQSHPESCACERYRELAVFPEDETLDIPVLQDLWRLSKADARRLAESFDDAGLATLDLSQGLHLHDVFLTYLRSQYDEVELRRLHRRLLQKWSDRNQLPHTYAWHWYGWHCLRAGEPERLASALLDLEWLSSRLTHSDLSTLLDDCRRAEDSILNQRLTFEALHNALALCSDVLFRSPGQLAAQLFSRLRFGQSPELGLLINQAEYNLKTQALRPLTQNLHPAGSPLKRTLRGHESTVWGARQLADGRLLSWSIDGTLRLWTANGTVLGVLEGHEYDVEAALELADGRLLSWSNNELRLWTADGAVLGVLKGHENTVEGALELADGHLLSWSYDGTLRLWAADGAPLDVFDVPRGHEYGVSGVLVLSHGRLLSWSQWTWPIQLWATDRSPLAVLIGHESGIYGAFELADGRLLSWSKDTTLRLWTADGTPLRTLTGHENEVNGALALTDGRLLSWSADKTLRLWTANGEPLSILVGHKDRVSGALALSDGRLLSWSSDKTLRLWTADGVPLSILAGHESEIKGVVPLANGKLLSWSGDRTLRLWTADGSPIDVLVGHEMAIMGALEQTNGRLLSWSVDQTLRLWSPSDVALSVIIGHDDRVSGALALDNGRMLSWSSDKTLRLWAADGMPLSTLVGHDDAVWGVLTLADGRLLSWSLDGTLLLWDTAGTEPRILAGHEGPIHRVSAFVADSRLLSWSDDGTLRLWKADGVSLGVVVGHESGVRGILLLTDGRLLSWANDGMLKLISADGSPLALLVGHESGVRGALELADGRLLSWSEDTTLRLWKADGTSLALLVGHESRVYGALELADGRLLSWSEDTTLRLWTVDGTPLRILTGHVNEVNGALTLSDGRLLSWSEDGTLRIWETDGTLLMILAGHERGIYRTLVLADGKVLSWSDDGSLRLWSADGADLGILTLFRHYDAGVLPLADGRLLSWSNDRILRLLSSFGEPVAELYFDAQITVVAKVPGVLQFLVGDCLGGVHWVEVS